MAQQTINVGAAPNDGTGTPLRTAFQYTNSNFTELYTAVGPSGNNIVVPGNATITGDLTVDTNVLKVDTSLNRVGVNNAAPSTNLHVGSGVGLNNLGVGLSRGATSNFYEAFDGTKTFLAGTDSAQAGVKVGSLTNHSVFLVCNNTTQLQIDPLGVFSFTDGAGGTRMTLNSTGLGVGDAPTADCKLTVKGGAFINRGASGGASQLLVSLAASSGGNFGQISNTGTRWALGYGPTLTTVGTEALIWDSSGNVGIGVTPSASHILSCAGPIGLSGTNSGTRTSYISNSGACSIYYTDGGGSGYFTDFGNLIIQPRTSSARSVVIATGSTTPVERAVVKSTGQVRFVPLASDPAGAEAGDVYYNSTSNKLKCYNGTTWNDLF